MWCLKVLPHPDDVVLVHVASRQSRVVADLKVGHGLRRREPVRGVVNLTGDGQEMFDQSDRWRAMRAAARIRSRVADPSMCWNGIGSVISDRRDGFYVPGRGAASGWRRSMSKLSAMQ